MELNEPGWKRNGRNGPLDWWLVCQHHGDNWESSCLSCGIAIDHNIDFQAKLVASREEPTPRRLSNREITPAMARIRERRAGYCRGYMRSVKAMRMLAIINSRSPQ